MQKIKNFRVNLHVKKVLCLIKKLVNTTELSENIKKSVNGIVFYYKFVDPSLIYDTFSREFFYLLIKKICCQNGEDCQEYFFYNFKKCSI